MVPYLQIDKRDNICVALSELNKGFEIKAKNDVFSIKETIPSKHKFAIKDFDLGEDIVMYGILVGKAIEPIEKGSVITVNNIKHASGKYTLNSPNLKWKSPDISKFKDRTFLGYQRADGCVGTANYWLVIPLTFCENRNLEVLESSLLEKLGYSTEKEFTINVEALIKKFESGASREQLYNTSIISFRNEQPSTRLFPNVDGIKFLRHEGGCGGTRQDAETLCRLLAGYIANPNVAGATILSLGCQNAQISMLKEELDKKMSKFKKPVYYLEHQKSPSEYQFIEDAIKNTFIGLIEANSITRKPALLNKLILGLECGGSDGFSGISANPALGHTSDLIVALGGTAVLSEFPELNGVEQEIMDRCSNRINAERFATMMHSYSEAAKASGSGFENNPSPGNIKDGLITDAMKSAGAAKKGGTSPITDVLDYTEKIKTPGLNLLCTPGNDVESTTGLAGSGCNIIVFTTGLGTPTGNPIVPVLKLSSNTNLFERMNDLIDLNAGTIISGEDTIENIGEKILEQIIETASGKNLAKATKKGQNDFIPWKRGVSL